MRVLAADIVPLMTVEWVDEPVHSAALAALLTANRRQPSLVDCVSFEIMRRRDLTRALALGSAFASQGFAIVP